MPERRYGLAVELNHLFLRIGSGFPLSLFIDFGAIAVAVFFLSVVPACLRHIN